MEIDEFNTAERDAFAEFLSAKDDANRANEALAEAERTLLGVMAENQRKSLSFVFEGKKFSTTYTRRTTNQINEEGLRKALGAAVFDKYTTKKLDRKALEGAMSNGDVDPVVVARFVEQVPGKEFITFRETDAKETHDEA